MSSRREFIGTLALAMAGAGYGNDVIWDILRGVSKSLIPSAHAQSLPGVKRVIEIGLRLGVPVIYIGTGREFTQLSGALYVNSPYRPEEYIQEGSLYLNPDSAPLKPFATNIAITQGVENVDGHTATFSIRKGGSGQRLASPIIELASKNTSGSAVSAVRFENLRNGSEIFKNSLDGLSDATNVTKSSLKELFKKPYMHVSDAEVSAIITASQKLSRHQSRILERSIKSVSNHAKAHTNATDLITKNAAQLLDTSAMATALTGNAGASIYQKFGQELALGLKSLEHNLVNSVQLSVNTNDWHGYQQIGQNRVFPQQMSIRLAEAIKFLKVTPDKASSTGETLWDTTVILLTSEFNRGLVGAGRNNVDGQTQGFIAIGKNVEGGYYGGFDLPNKASALGQSSGIDPITGAPKVASVSNPLPGKNSPAEAYSTFQALLGNKFDNSKVLKAMIKGRV